MLKSIALFLLSALSMPVALNATSTTFNHASEPKYVLKDEDNPDVLHGYTYTDVTSTENHELYRTYDTDELTPAAVRQFYAPSGYVFNLGPEQWQIEEMLDQMIFFDANFKFMEVMVAYKLSGSTVTIYRTLMPGVAPDTSVDVIRDYFVGILMNDFSKTQLFKIENAVSEFAITPVIDIRFSRDGGNPTTHLTFNGKPVYTKPFDPSDFIFVAVSYVRVAC